MKTENLEGHTITIWKPTTEEKEPYKESMVVTKQVDNSLLFVVSVNYPLTTTRTILVDDYRITDHGYNENLVLEIVGQILTDIESGSWVQHCKNRGSLNASRLLAIVDRKQKEKSTSNMPEKNCNIRILDTNISFYSVRIAVDDNQRLNMIKYAPFVTAFRRLSGNEYNVYINTLYDFSKVVEWIENLEYVEKYEPKVGDRVRIIKGADELSQNHIGETGKLLVVDMEDPDGWYYGIRVDCGLEVWVSDIIKA